jgi:hypothetical protein
VASQQARAERVGLLSAQHPLGDEHRLEQVNRVARASRVRIGAGEVPARRACPGCSALSSRSLSTSTASSSSTASLVSPPPVRGGEARAYGERVAVLGTSVAATAANTSVASSKRQARRGIGQPLLRLPHTRYVDGDHVVRALNSKQSSRVTGMPERARCRSVYLAPHVKQVAAVELLLHATRTGVGKAMNASGSEELASAPRATSISSSSACSGGRAWRRMSPADRAAAHRHALPEPTGRRVWVGS